MTGLAAVLWDMDGTLVDTEPYWIEAEFELAEAHGATWSRELAMNLVGNDLRTSAAFIADAMGLRMSHDEIVEILLDGVIERVQRHVPWRPGALDLLADLNEHAVPCALVTMSYARFAQPVVDALPPQTFTHVVTGDQVQRGKPDPESYTRAAELLGVEPQRCLAIEDSATGAAAAQQAGCIVLAVPNHVGVGGHPRRYFRSSLRGLSAESLGRLLV